MTHVETVRVERSDNIQVVTVEQLVASEQKYICFSVNISKQTILLLGNSFDPDYECFFSDKNMLTL